MGTLTSGTLRTVDGSNVPAEKFMAHFTSFETFSPHRALVMEIVLEAPDGRGVRATQFDILKASKRECMTV
ncbi:hypothetical protein TWF730_011234 [Orbilia blumenaviensis]|uniref:Uncharacterized protein n=1 Tax=Orbilia blumenaviensis TaxID=1796055 RepID=A0AAV9UJW4_9PEZI